MPHFLDHHRQLIQSQDQKKTRGPDRKVFETDSLAFINDLDDSHTIAL